jgi:hypothetical protein
MEAWSELEMRLTSAIAIVTLAAGFSVGLAANETKDFKKLMKTAAHADDQLKSALKEQNAAAVQTSAEELSTSMAEMADFWKRRGAKDAVEWSEVSKRAAEDIAAKVNAGDFAAAQSAWDASQESCEGCHKAHRKLGFGGWRLK